MWRFTIKGLKRVQKRIKELKKELHSWYKKYVKFMLEQMKNKKKKELLLLWKVSLPLESRNSTRVVVHQFVPVIICNIEVLLKTEGTEMK